MAINNDIYYESSYNFFDINNVSEHAKFFNEYLNNGEVSEYVDGLNSDYKLVAQAISIKSSTLDTLTDKNLNVESSIKFKANKNGGNFVIGLLPDLKQLGMDEHGRFSREVFNSNNKHKLYKVLGLNGSSRYSVFTATVAIDPSWDSSSGSDPKFVIQYMNNTKTNFLIDDSVDIYGNPISLVDPYNGKVSGKVLTRTPKGYMRYTNADYNEILKKIIGFNISTADGSNIFRDEKAINEITSILNNTNEPISLINFVNAFSRRGTLGVMQDSYRNSSMQYGYLSGTELEDMLNVDNSSKNLINKDYTYRLKFSAFEDDGRILDITPIDSNGKVVTKFIENIDGRDTVVNGFKNTRSYQFITKFDNNKYFNRSRAMYKIAHLDSKLSQYLRGDDVRKYNSQIIDLFENKKMTREKSYEIANELVNDYRKRLLDAYGFNSREDFDTNDYTKSFLNIYNNLKIKDPNAEALHAALFDNLDVGMIAGNIYEGKLFDNLLSLNTQNQSIENKKYAISKAFQFAFGYENSDTQRKAQSINALPGFKLKNSEGKAIDINEIIGNMFSNVKEMEYKKTKFVNQQANEVINKFGKYLGMTPDTTPNVNPHSFIRSLYTYAGDFAFNESNSYTTAALMQSISMYDSKKDFIVPFNVIKRDVFEDLDDDAIKDFYKALQKSNYNLDKVSVEHQRIFYEKLMKNLLGQETFEKFNRGVYDGDTIIKELNEIGEQVKRIGSLEDNTEEAILTMENVAQSFNAWMQKNFIISDNLSDGQILNQEMINNNFSGTVRGANFFGFDGFEVTPQGIKFKLKYGMIAGHGAKMMNDNIKATVGMTSHLLAIDYDNVKIFIDSIINEKPTSGKRNFTGTEIARTLTTAALNAINSEYEGQKTLTKAEKFKLFKKSMGAGLPVKEGLTRRKNMNNIFEILNVDMDYDEATGSIVFIDKNVEGALKYFNALDDTAYESIDARIIENVMKHRQELFGKNFVIEEGKVLSGFIDSLMEHNYGVLLGKMTEQSKKRSIIFLRDDKDYGLSKSYIDGQEVGMFNIGHFRGGKILYTAQTMMHEPKSRKDVFGLKLGRLSALTLTELGMGNMVELLKSKSTSPENINKIIDYLALAAQRGTDYDRGSSTGYFYKVFKENGKVINLNDLDDIPYSSFNSKATTFLANSPFGKLLKYDFKTDRLLNTAKGLITGFDSAYMSNLESFFDSKNVNKMLGIIGGSSKYAVLENEFAEAVSIIKNMNTNSFMELKSKSNAYKNLNSRKVLEALESIQGKLQDALTGIKDDTLQKSLESFKDIILLSQNNPDADIKLSDEFAKYRDLIQGSLRNNKSFNKTEKKVLDFVFEVMNKRSNFSQKGFNIYKTMLSIANVYQSAALGSHRDVFFGIKDEKLKLKLMDELYNFGLDRNQQYKFYKHYLNFGYGTENTSKKLKNGTIVNPINVLKSFFYNFNSIEKENIFGIIDLQQISQYGNIGFIIDSFNVDKNGDTIPNADIASYERIVRSNNILKKLQKERSTLHNFINNFKNKQNSEMFDEIGKEFSQYLKTNTDGKNYQKLENIYKHIAGVYANEYFYRNKTNFIPDEILSKLLFDESYLSLSNSTPVRVVTDEISRKMNIFKSQITADKIDNANILSAYEYQNVKFKHLKDVDINTMDLSGIKFTQEQLNIINKSIKNGRFSVKEFYSQIAFSYGVNSKTANNENIYKSVVELEEFVKNLFVSTYRDALNKGAKEFKSDYKEMRKGGLATAIKNALGLGNRKYSSLYAFTIGEMVNNEELMEKYDEELTERFIKMNADIMVREQDRAKRLYSKGGALYDITSVMFPDSASFSPREASGITDVIKSEAESIFKNRKFDNAGKIVDSQELDDFKKALKLIYGESIADEHIQKFDELYHNRDVDTNLLRKSLVEMKNKLDLYSGIVMGTEEDWKKMNKLHWFSNGSNVYTGYLARHPHQYKFSISSNRFIKLDETNRNLSFIGKYIGSESTINSSQTSLMFIGKLTSMLANGDFDGDVFQVMSLGERSLDIKDLENMTSKQFMKALQKKSKLFYLLRNVAGEDLKNIFGNEMYDWNLYDSYNYLIHKKNKTDIDYQNINKLQRGYETMQGKKYAEIRNRIIDIYSEKRDGKRYFGDYQIRKRNGITYFFDNADKKWKTLSSSDVYRRIEDDFLSMSNEFFRVSRKLKKEINAHKTLHSVSGFYELELVKGKNAKVSKKTLLTFLATLDGKYRDKLFNGQLDKLDLLEAINKNNFLYREMNEELRQAYKVDNGVSLMTFITKNIKEDDHLTTIRTVSNEINTFLQNVGQAKSGEVHDKLTKYRSMMNSLLQNGAMEDVKTYLNKIGVAYDSDVYDVGVLKAFNWGHNIGTLIEDLSISAKKGNGISPDRFVEGFNKGEALIRESQLDFDFKKVAGIIRGLQQEANSTLNELKKANPSADVLDLLTDNIIGGKISNELGEQTIYDFFKNMFKNQNVDVMTNNKNTVNSFHELMKTYLRLFTELTEDEINKYLNTENVKKVKMSQIFTKYGDEDYIKNLAVFGSIMHKGTVERDTGVKDFDSDPVFKIIFKKGKYNFLKRTADFLKFIGFKGLGSRIEGKYLSWLDNNKIIEEIEKRSKQRSSLDDIAAAKEEEVMKDAEEKIKVSEENVNDTINNTDENVNENINTEDSINKDSSENIKTDTETESKYADDIEDEIDDEESNQSSDKSSKRNQNIDEDDSEIKGSQTADEAADNSESDSDIIKRLKKELDEKNKKIEELKNNSYKEQAESIGKRNSQLEKELEDSQSIIKRLEKEAAELRAKIQSGTANVSSAKPKNMTSVTDNINNAKKFIGEHKKMTAAALGAVVLAGFFRIFQSNRPVVNLDINEKEYERSQGSVYRNLGQYTMNTNIRSLY